MNYVYGALLLHSAGKPIDEEHLKKVISSTGEHADDAKVKVLVSALDGVDIAEAISKAAMPVAVAAAPAAGGAAAPVKEEKSEEDVAKQAEAASEGLSSLFG